MVNKAEFSSNELFAIFGQNNCLNFDYSIKIIGVSTDTREIADWNLFVALKGETFDGNEKIIEAFEKGAVAAIVQKDYFSNKEEELKNKRLIIVENTIHALGALAAYHRGRFELPVLFVGGSNGKTTTKEMIASILSTKFNILKTESNFNNQIGVPLTLLKLNNYHELAIIEGGTNEPGEISILASIAAPTHGLITNIGREHLEKLIDIDGVEMEETYLFGFLRKHDGYALINYDDERLRKYSLMLDKRFLFGNNQECDMFASISINDKLQAVVNFKYEGTENRVNLSSVGYASGLNAIAAIATGLLFNLSPEEIIESLERFTPDDSHGYARMIMQNFNDVIVLNDCYNANPDSMMMSLKTLEAYITKGKKIAVLGDMREMGEASADEHSELLKNAVSIADSIYTYGPEMFKASSTISVDKILSFNSQKELVNKLKENLSVGDVILLKGSRGMKMENILNELFQ